MNMKYYRFVFCILTYKNVEDIKECLSSIKEKVKDFKIVIVNSFFDEETESIIKSLALNNDCDFLSVQNKGYGSGNNRGIEFIKEHYDFDYLVISNPDIIISKFEESYELDGTNVIAPLITTKDGKNQNPYWLIMNKWAEKMLYKSIKTRSKFLYVLSIGMNKIIREIGLFLFMCSKKKTKKVCGAHGSFMLVSKNAINKFDSLYDENMFLFAEESLLAHEFIRRHIPVILTKNIRIIHKEDGSVGLAKFDERKIANESIVYYYEKIYGSK